MECDTCRYNAYDEGADEYYCSLELDEDELVSFYEQRTTVCRFYRPANAHTWIGVCKWEGKRRKT